LRISLRLPRALRQLHLLRLLLDCLQLRSLLRVRLLLQLLRTLLDCG
jgi:hypothetical protein